MSDLSSITAGGEKAPLEAGGSSAKATMLAFLAVPILLVSLVTESLLASQPDSKSTRPASTPELSRAPRDESVVVHEKKFPSRRLSVSFDDDGDAIVLTRDHQEKRLSPPADCFWDEPIFTPNGKYGFVIANKGSKWRGFWHVSIFRIALPDAKEDIASTKAELVLAATDLKGAELKNPTVGEIYSASDDGKRLLVLVAYEDVSKSIPKLITYSARRPFFLDLDAKRLKPILP